jgi:two-component system, NtrC family, response regulator AtoC
MRPVSALAALLGQSEGITALRERVDRLIERHAGSRRFPPLLIQGETGTGKSLLARSLHQASPRAAEPFIDVNCAAIPDSLLEAELFGFERGAFTDARQSKAGLFQAAHRGTMFLDELHLLPRTLQGKLLTAVEDRTIRRLGSNRSEPVDVWLVAATSEDLLGAARDGRFHDALYHRLSVVTLSLPPLRERGADILLLAEHFLERACAEHALSPKVLAPDAQSALRSYQWPGNVRELINVTECVALMSDVSLVTRDVLALPVSFPRREPTSDAPAALRDAVGSVERRHLLEALTETDWVVTHAAARLGIPPNTLRYRMKKYHLHSGGGIRPSTRKDERHPPPVTAPSIAGAIRWTETWVAILRAVLVDPQGGGRSGDAGRALATLAEKVQTFGGHLERVGLKALVAAFGLEPSDDAARRAAHAAMAVQKVLARGRVGDPEAYRAKIGVHIARLPVGRAGDISFIDEDAKSDAWAVIDALAEAAEPGTTIVSQNAARFLRRYFDLAPCPPPRELDGPGYRLLAGGRSGSAPSGRTSPFVGRTAEFDLLRSRLAAAERGSGQVVAIAGEAGIGKSRLLSEFCAHLAAFPSMYVQGRCLSYTSSTPYSPLLDINEEHLWASRRRTPGHGKRQAPSTTHRDDT